MKSEYQEYWDRVPPPEGALEPTAGPALSLISQRAMKVGSHMRALLAGMALALVLSAAPVVAFADEGEDTDTQGVVTPDPGIKALHQAVKDMKAAKLALATECSDHSTAKCKAAFKDVRDSFKEARVAAIAEHHAFKQEQKKARDLAKEKAKATLKNKAEKAKAKGKLSPTPLPTPRG